MTESDSTAPVHTPAPAGRRHTVRTALLAIVALLIGVGVGLWLASGLHDDAPTPEVTPAADSAAAGFAQDMIRHHEQGVEMATIELDRGTDPQVRSMAFDILTAQSNEIGQMQSWLTRWGLPLINPGPPMAWMPHQATSSASTDPHAGHHMPGMPADKPSAETPPMPGMATSGEMAHLRSLRGTQADVYFLQLMLRHHEGGLHMMEFAADPANVSQGYVRDLASAMKRTQDKEIAVITQMLAERHAAPLPMN